MRPVFSTAAETYHRLRVSTRPKIQLSLAPLGSNPLTRSTTDWTGPEGQLARQVPAVDGVRAPGDERESFRAGPDDSVRDLLGRAHPAERFRHREPKTWCQIVTPRVAITMATIVSIGSFRSTGLAARLRFSRSSRSIGRDPNSSRVRVVETRRSAVIIPGHSW